MLHANNPGPLDNKEDIDINAWRRFLERNENEQDELLFHRMEKIGEIRKFRRSLVTYAEAFKSAGTILEIGGGSCWAAYLVKRLYPHARVVGSDIAPAAIETHNIWSGFFNTAIDQAFACKSYEIPVADNTFDLAFCFEAAHHFGKHDKTFKELFRVLKPGGQVLYLTEPTCSRLLYSWAHKRVNRRLEKDGVPEDVLIHKHLLALAEANGFEASIRFDPHVINRGPLESVYYAALNQLPLLQSLLPCTADFIFKRPQ